MKKNIILLFSLPFISFISSNNCSLSKLVLQKIKSLLLLTLFIVSSFNMFAQTSSLISACGDFVAGPNTTWTHVLVATTVADGAVSQGAQTYTMNVTSLPAGGANVRVYKTTANGNDFFGNPLALTLGSNSITVAAVTFDRAVKFQFSSGDVEFDALSLNGVSSTCIVTLPALSSSLISACGDFVAGPNANWTHVLVATTVADGAISQGAQTYTMNVTSLPVGGANVRVYKTTANGSNFFANPLALTLGSNSITVAAVTFDRAVKFQFSSGDVEFDALSLNGEASDCVCPTTSPVTDLVVVCDSYTWIDGNTYTSSNNTATHTLINADGCDSVVILNLVITSSVNTSVSTSNVSCNGFTDGSVVATATGGASPNYQYSLTILFSNVGLSQTSGTFSNLTAGTYSLDVTDINGCSSNQVFTITEPNPLFVNAFSTDISCFGYCDGSAFSMPSGGTAPYSYLWSNGNITDIISGLCAGAYVVNITDANNCVNIETVVISEPLTLVSNNTINGCDSVLIGSNYYTISGAYTDTLTSVNGCDSVVNTNLTIEQNTSSYDTLSVSASIVWNGITLNVSGNYSVTLINSLGCDSIVNLNLTVTTTGISDIANSKSNLVKITDMLGQETPYKRNTPLFYIYDDGKVEKRIIIE